MKKKISAIGFPVIPQPYQNESGVEETPNISIGSASGTLFCYV